MNFVLAYEKEGRAKGEKPKDLFGHGPKRSTTNRTGFNGEIFAEYAKRI